MPCWVFYCRECGEPFTYRAIGKGTPDALPFGPKPEVPAAGVRMECPGCKRFAVYVRDQLTYQPAGPE